MIGKSVLSLLRTKKMWNKSEKGRENLVFCKKILKTENDCFILLRAEKMYLKKQEEFVFIKSHKKVEQKLKAERLIILNGKIKTKNFFYIK